MSKNLTPWFPSDTKPVRSGVYRTRFRNSDGWVIETGYSYWSNPRKEWSNQERAASTVKVRYFTGAVQDKEWRGLAQCPTASVRKARARG